MRRSERTAGQAARAKATWWQKGSKARLNAGLVALSTAAIASVYTVGYFQTEASATDLVSTASATTVAVPRTAATAQPPVTNAVPRAQAPATAASSATSYTDGTYIGVGTSRHGNIQATVVVQGGRVVSAEITQCATRYPCSKVASLPARVLAKQAASTDYVAGSTDSSKAYMGAIRQALAQATAA